MPNADLLQVRDLRVSFATERGEAKVLDGVNLTIGQGRIMGLVGESGSGKTTLARAILGILPANATHIGGGSIRFAGEELLSRDPRSFDAEIRGRRITFIPQDPFGSLNPLFRVGGQMMELMKWKSPRRNAREGRGLGGLFAPYRRTRRRADRAAVIDMLRAVQIPQPERALDKLSHEFSGGQRQRLMIAMALLPEPDLVIADEPTTALDVTIQAQILKVLKRLAKERGISVLFTTHDLGVAYEICDEITVMYAGQDVETAPVDVFFRNPAHPYTARLLDSLPDPRRGFREIGGEIPSLVAPPPGCRFHPRCGFASDACPAARPDPVAVEGAHAVRCHHPLARTLEAD